MLLLHVPVPGDHRGMCLTVFYARRMRLCFYVIRSFLPSLPGRRRDAHLRIKSEVAAGSMYIGVRGQVYNKAST